MSYVHSSSNQKPTRIYAVKMHCTDTINNGTFYVFLSCFSGMQQFAGNLQAMQNLVQLCLLTQNKANVEWFHVSLGTFLQSSGPDASSEHSTSEN